MPQKYDQLSVGVSWGVFTSGVRPPLRTKVRSRSLCSWENLDNFRITGPINRVLLKSGMGRDKCWTSRPLHTDKVRKRTEPETGHTSLFFFVFEVEEQMTVTAI